MSNPAEPWPSSAQFATAIMAAEGNFDDERLRGLRVQRHQQLKESPWFMRGRFGYVFKLEGGGGAYALKVFRGPQEDRQQRYRLIDRHLASMTRPRRLVSFAYREEGIQVGGRAFPTLRMDWAYGEALDSYLDKRFGTGAPVDNEELVREWITTMRELHDARIAHGDLQHHNVLVQSDGTFRLVDYDGFFVPAMRQYGLGACEAGVASYQHPGREKGAGRFDERMDDFSALVILLTLACVDADLWERYHEDSHHLLVEEGDLLRPEKSALLKELSGRNGTVGRLASQVREAAAHDISQVPPFGEVVSGAGMKWDGPGAGQGQGTAAGPAASRAQAPSYAQRQIAAMHADGKSAEEIAAVLGLTRASVEAQVRLLGPAPERAGPPASPARKPSPAVPADPAPPPQRRLLTPRQQEVLGLLQSGLTAAQIASRLQVSVSTVNRHLSAIRTQVGDDAVRGLVQQALARRAAPPATPAASAAREAAPAAPTTTPWWQSAAGGHQPPAREPAGTATPSPPVTPAAQVTPAPGRSGAGSSVAAALMTIVLILIVISILVSIFS